VETKVESNNDIRKLYRIYYRLDPPLILPRDMNKREFAFHPWDSPSYVRHLSFSDERELRSFISSNTPLHVYHSIAVYELPEAPKMEEKGLLGAELLFDIDADHLLGCQGVIDDSCIQKAADEAGRLSRILERDLGAVTFTYFTGNRGFHVRAWCPYCLELDRDARREIASYVRCENLELRRIFPDPNRLSKGMTPATPTPDDPGWRGWIGRALAEGSGDTIPPSLEEALGRMWDQRILDLLDSMCVDVDAQVTQDTSRLTRIPGSLNGKASLIVAYTENPSSFKPSLALTPFKGDVEVLAKQEVEATLLGTSVALKSGKREVLPAGVGILLATKGLADIVSGDIIVRADPGWRPLQGVDWPPRTT